jgi:hypothetical protein
MARGAKISVSRNSPQVCLESFSISGIAAEVKIRDTDTR